MRKATTCAFLVFFVFIQAAVQSFSGAQTAVRECMKFSAFSKRDIERMYFCFQMIKLYVIKKRSKTRRCRLKRIDAASALSCYQRVRTDGCANVVQNLSLPYPFYPQNGVR